MKYLSKTVDPTLTTERIRVEHNGDIVIVTVTQPEKKNTQTREVLVDFHHALSALAASQPMPRVLILAADGDGLWIGKADTEFLLGCTEDDGLWASHIAQANARLLDRMPIVTIAAIDGEARGGGLEMAMACDFAFASSRSSFIQSEARAGVIPGFGGTFRLPQHVGSMRARYMAYRGIAIDAQTAKEWGLVIDIVEPEHLMETVLKAAHEVLECQTGCVREIKRLIAEFAEVPLDISNRIEQQSFARTMGSQEMEAGMRNQNPQLFSRNPPSFFRKRFE